MRKEDDQPSGAPASDREFLRDLWEEHMRCEFATHNTEDTLATMVEDAYVNHIPILTGGVGKEEFTGVYSQRFIPQMPPDTEITPISRTIGADQLVDGVEVPLVAVVRFRDNKLAHEHIQASVLVQLGLLEPGTLPVAGIESARKALDPKLPSNTLMDRRDSVPET